MADRDSNLANAFATTLSAQMDPTDLTATVVTTSGGPVSPCYLVIDPDDAAKREYVYFDGTFTGTTFVTSSTGNRYLSGSAAGSGLTHLVGAVVRCVPAKQHFDDLHDRIDAVLGLPTLGTARRVLRVNAAGNDREYGLPFAIGGRWRRAAAQSVPNNTITALTADTEDWDTDGFGTAAAASWTVPAGFGGQYTVFGYASFAAAAGGTRYVRVNSPANNVPATQRDTNPSASASSELVVSAPVVLTAAQTIQLEVFQDSGGSLNVTGMVGLIFEGPTS